MNVPSSIIPHRQEVETPQVMNGKRTVAYAYNEMPWSDSKEWSMVRATTWMTLETPQTQKATSDITAFT